MNKKASEDLELYIINLFFIGLIFIIFWVGISKVQDNSIHNQIAKTRDIAFTYDTASLASGNLNLVYSTSYNYSISISQLCKVSLQDKVKKIPVIYFCNQKTTSVEFLDKDNAYLIRKQKNE